MRKLLYLLLPFLIIGCNNSYYDVYAVFDNIDGVTEGTIVTINGEGAGYVYKKQLTNDNKLKLTLKIDAQYTFSQASLLVVKNPFTLGTALRIETDDTSPIQIKDKDTIAVVVEGQFKKPDAKMVATPKTEQPKEVFPDTVGLKQFWKDFKKDISTNNVKSTAARLDYPIRAIHPVLFKYSYSCDTITYIKNEEKYANVDINKGDMPRYFDFVFDDVLKNIISKISYQDLLQQGHLSENSVSFCIFPKHYMQVPCPNDHNLHLYLIKRNNEWSVSIGGL
ncbi:MlaD family protein [Flavobacterium sp. ST-75]|uniref:MlaD family protein n=1 Tax=Flavobacterium rhizophilum TaxID=3163296 RepID=A0ABW8YCP6_9FLAO